MDTKTLLRVFGGCARREIRRYFLSKSCVASTAAAMDVMEHYGRDSRPWEVCARVVVPPYDIELGCYPAGSEETVGGHLVALVEDAFLVDASLGQVNDRTEVPIAPSVFVGELLPPGAAVREKYEFKIPSGTVSYRSRPMSRNYRSLPDWGPSPERDYVKAAIIRQIEGFVASQSDA